MTAFIKGTRTAAPWMLENLLHRGPVPISSHSHDKAGRCSQWNGRLARSILTQSQLAVVRCAFPIQPHFFASTDLFQIDLSPFRFAPTALALSP